jgi:hypothetical protein
VTLSLAAKKAIVNETASQWMRKPRKGSTLAERGLTDESPWRAVTVVAALPGIAAEGFAELLMMLGLLPYESVPRPLRGTKTLGDKPWKTS